MTPASLQPSLPAWRFIGLILLLAGLAAALIGVMSRLFEQVE